MFFDDDYVGHRSPARQKPWRFWLYLFSLALGFGFLVLSSVSLEVLYRIKTRHLLGIPIPFWVADPDLVFKLNTELPEFPQGFRGKAPTANKEAAFRIVCLGGSTTFGHGVQPDKAWPAVVQRVLKKKGIDAEVINAGVPGYGSRQLLLRYRRDIVPLKSDYVVLYEGWNRTGPLVDPQAWVPYGYGILRPGETQGWKLTNYIVLHSLILQRIATSIVIRRDKARGWSMDPYQDVFVSDFTELVKEIQAHGQHPILVLYPALYFLNMTPAERSLFEPMLYLQRPFQENMVAELQRKHAALRSIAQTTGTPLIDVQADVSSNRGQDRRTLFRDEMHLSARGNQRVGEIIAGFVADLIAQSLEESRHHQRSALPLACHAFPNEDRGTVPGFEPLPWLSKIR